MHRKMQKTCHQAEAADAMLILDADKRLRAFEKLSVRAFRQGTYGLMRGISGAFAP